MLKNVTANNKKLTVKTTNYEEVTTSVDSAIQEMVVSNFKKIYPHLKVVGARDELLPADPNENFGQTTDFQEHEVPLVQQSFLEAQFEKRIGDIRAFREKSEQNEQQFCLDEDGALYFN